MKKTGVNKRRFRWYKEKEKKAARICSVKNIKTTTIGEAFVHDEITIHTHFC